MQTHFNGSQWHNIETMPPESFVCWNCEEKLASEKGYSLRTSTGTRTSASIYICHFCKAPNIFDSSGKTVNSIAVGKNIKNLPDDIKTLYLEARKCISAGAYTGSVMLFRKLLMNIAVEEGADEGKNFVSYVDYLNGSGIIPKKSYHLADKVRTLGNDANHKIEQRTYSEAMQLLVYIELLLHCNYEIVETVNV